MTVKNNFTLLEERYLPEEEATLYHYEHKKTKARLLHMKNEDPNKVFIIGFRTPPLGSTGNCHILEHCVLNGSRKYKTKEPFMDLLKSSLQTFLNAMTYPDRTVYPVASRNDVDFANLMDLYLDAVFYPNATRDPLIFRQEGWRYELFNKEDPINYQGVVYNEMKGAMSSAEDQVSDQISERLYPDSIYGENSGGNPYDIPSLSFEDFSNYHKKYYHPSNSWTFLYGDIDEEETFQRLEDYFKDFDYQEVKSLADDVGRFNQEHEYKESYSLSPSEDPTKQTYLSYSWLLKPAQDEERLLLQLFPAVLVNSEASPLRQALLKELDCEDVYCEFSPVREPAFSIVVKNVGPEDGPLFKEIVDRYMTSFAEEGLDKDLLFGELQSAEFSLREKGNFATKGIILGLSCLSGWIYDENPIDALSYREKLDSLREGAHGRLFEDFIQENFIENAHRVFIVHEPQPGLNVDRDKKVREGLDAYKAALSDDELDKLIEENEALRTRQDSGDSAEAKETIPQLTREDLPIHIEKLPRELVEKDGLTFLYHDLPTSDIHYIDFVFDVDHVSREEAEWLALICELVGMMDTENYSYSDYSNKESLYTGGITTRARLYRDMAGDRNDFSRKIIVSTKFLGVDHLEQGLNLIEEQLFRSLFSDQARMLEVLKMIQSYYQSSLVQSGHQLARARALSSLSALDDYNQALNGFDYYLFIKDLVKNYGPDQQAKIEEAYGKLFSTDGLIVNITSDGESMKKIGSAIEERVKSWPKDKEAYAPISFTPYVKKEAFITSTDVQFVSTAAEFSDDRFTGDLFVLQRILSNEYLYNEIRAKGGAYGAGMTIDVSQKFATYSYRDPKLLETLEVYRNLDEAVAKLDLSSEDLDRFLIGAVGAYDQPMTERQKGMQDLTDYLINKPEDHNDRLLNEMLAADLESLKAYQKNFAAIKNEQRVAVIGSEGKVKEAEDYFDEIIQL